MLKMSLEEYLGERGLLSPISDYMLDKLRHPHGLTARQRKKLEKDNMKYAKEYSEKRNMAIAEYNNLVNKGEIIPKTRLEKIIDTAKHGHLDNESTKAAIKILEKRGIVFERQ